MTGDDAAYAAVTIGLITLCALIALAIRHYRR